MNIVTGERDVLAGVLAKHDDVDAVWYAGSAEGAALVERASAGNLKRTWILSRPPRSVRNCGPKRVTWKHLILKWRPPMWN